MKNYNYFERLVHDLSLKKKFIKKSLYELEKIFFLKKNFDEIINENHVFISGLPRSGTTILLNFFFSTNQFGSFTYENMPFIMSPNIFSKLKISSNFKKKERYHKDGIFTDLKSPESFDEIFFSSFNEKEISDELINFVSLLLLNKNKNKYLSKNNLNFRRIELIKKKLPNSFFLIPYREPLQQSYSLLNQHKNFISVQNKNKFVTRYMNYLGHNEFGNNHKSWNEPKLFHNYFDINYWLEQWLIFYKIIFNQYKFDNNCYFICYENLDNVNYIQNLSKITNLNQIINFEFKVNKIKNIKDFDNGLYSQALELYNEIKNKNLIS